MSAPIDRLVQNQRTSRYANERLHFLAGDIVAEDRLVPFLCECADDLCLGRVEMSLAEYDKIHVDRDTFSILAEHRRVDGERVIDRRDTYEVVMKSPGL